MAPLTKVFFTLLLAGASTLAAPYQAGTLEARSTDDVLSGITAISDQLSTLSASLEKFSGGFNGTLDALKIQGQTTDLIKNINNASTAVNATSSFNQDDSIKITNSVVSLQGKIYTTLDLLVSKKPAFDTAILGAASASFLVKDDLDKLRKATGDFGYGIVDRLVADLKKLGPLLTSDIDFHFVQAIRAYSWF